MTQTEIKIIPPEGYEIDTENSTMDCIKFKKIERKDITMEDVWKNMVNTSSFFDKNNNLYPRSCYPISGAGRYAKVAAFAALSDIAEYYNRGWKPNWKNDYEKKWFIYYNHIEDAFRLDNQYSECHGCVYFKNMDDTQAVIDNPNFREILDVLFKA